jgi:hypothetical protein
MTAPVPTQLIVGPSTNGVVEYAADLGSALAARASRGPGERTAGVEVLPVADAFEALEAAQIRPLVHLHVTDALFGSRLEDAASAVARIVGATSVSVTLHDVPQVSDGERNLVRRGAAYRRMLAGAVGVAVSSRHEAALAAEHLEVEAAVMPLGTRRRTSPAVAARSTGRAAAPSAGRSAGRGAAPPDGVEVVVAGYVYPGKGHDDVIRAAGLAARRLGSAVTVTALGGAAPGHSDEVDSLRRLAREQGVEFALTGRLDDDEYHRRCRSAGIPVVAHRHYSASRSLLDWAEQGRRALVVDTRYSREMALLRPGTLTVVEPSVEALASAIQAGAQDPASTVLDAGHPIGPSLDDVASMYLAWWESLPW